jgi:hypothetical protein
MVTQYLIKLFERQACQAYTFFRAHESCVTKDYLIRKCMKGFREEHGCAWRYAKVVGCEIGQLEQEGR